MRKMLMINILCASAVASAPAKAQDSSFLTDIQLRRLPTCEDIRGFFTTNPAAMHQLDSLSMAEFHLGANHLQMNEPMMEQNGDGHTVYTLGAKAYKRLDHAGTAWGQAGYASSTIHGVRWTDCIGYDYVAPYTLGDDKGGDLRSQRYEFAGGYAARLGQWTVGAHIAYRAEIAYRDIDPRVKTVVSDLKARAGVALPTGERYLTTFTAGFSRYDQNCNIDFYNPINDTNTYPLTGLGSWYHRFTGNTNKSSGNEAMGWSAGLALLSADGDGANVEISYENYRMEQRLRSFNNIVPGFTDNDILNARASYTINTTGELVISPVASFTMHRRRGTENLFGTAAGSSYDKIGQRKAYRRERMRAEAKCHLQFKACGGYLTLIPGGSYSADNERLIDPERLVRVGKAAATLGADYSRTAGKWLWQTTINCGYSHVTDREAVLTGLDLSSPLGKCVEHNYHMLSADSMSASAKLSAGHLCGNILVNLSAGAQVVRYDSHGCSRQIFASISTTF